MQIFSVHLLKPAWLWEKRREEKRREEKRREEKRRDNLLTIQASPFAYRQNNTFIYFTADIMNKFMMSNSSYYKYSSASDFSLFPGLLPNYAAINCNNTFYNSIQPLASSHNTYTLYQNTSATFPNAEAKTIYAEAKIIYAAAKTKVASARCGNASAKTNLASAKIIYASAKTDNASAKTKVASAKIGLASSLGDFAEAFSCFPCANARLNLILNCNHKSYFSLFFHKLSK